MSIVICVKSQITYHILEIVYLKWILDYDGRKKPLNLPLHTIVLSLETQDIHYIAYMVMVLPVLQSMYSSITVLPVLQSSLCNGITCII